MIFFTDKSCMCADHSYRWLYHLWGGVWCELRRKGRGGYHYDIGVKVLGPLTNSLIKLRIVYVQVMSTNGQNT